MEYKMVTKRDKKDCWRMFCLNNDEEGKATLKGLRKALNRGRYIIRVRGRGPNRFLYDNYNHEVPLKEATQMVVYISERPEIILERQNRISNWQEATR